MSIQFWVYIGLSLLSFAGLLFGVFWMKSLIKNQVLSQAVLNSNNHDLWGMFPGKSKIILHKLHYFYNFTNVNEFFQNKKPIVQESGPFNIFENQEFLNCSFNNETDSVRYKFYRYYNGTQDDYNKQSNHSIYTLNLPALAVWYQIKTISKSQVGLKALYTIMTTLQNDFFINVCLQMLQTSANNYNNFLSLLSAFSYLTPQQLSLMYSDPNYGFNSSTGFFAKAMLLHPSDDSRFFQNYYNLTFFDVTQLSNVILNKIDNLVPVFMNQRQVKQDFSPLNLSLIQWRDTSIAQASLIKFNSSTPGYIEYGSFLKYFTNYTTNLTVAQCEKLLAFNDAVPSNKSIIVRLSKIFNPNYNPIVNDSLSLLNKGNLDKILSLNEADAISFINDTLQINNTVESTHIYKYLNYLCTEVAFQTSLGGTKGIAGMTDFLSSQFYDVINSISNSLFNNFLSIKLYQTMFQEKDCEVQLFNLINMDINYKQICANPELNTTKRRNLDIWISGIIFENLLLQKYLNFTDLQFISLKDTKLANLIYNLVEEFQSKYNIRGNYRSMNLLPLGVKQWYDSSVTNDEDFGTYKTNSVREWEPETFQTYIPEISNFCQIYSFNCSSQLPSLEEIQKYINFDNLFSGLFLQRNVFIPYFNSTVLNSTSLSTSTMVSYLKYIFTEKMLGGLFTTKSVYDLIWGYKDPFLEYIRTNNYYLGGDPTLDSKFSLGQNMTEPPQGEDSYFEIYSGNKNKSNTRSYIKVFGYSDSKMMIREKYFDGKTIKTSFRQPWNEPVDVEGTDAMSFRPDNLDKQNITAFLDDLYRNGGFHYYNTKVLNGLTTNRYILNEDTILSKKYNPSNEKYYSDKFNGYSNMSSIIKAPFFAHKPYYFQCNDTPAEMLPQINMLNWTSDSPGEKDDQTLFNDSFIDVEPYSGATIRAGQKIMISALIEKDELFEMDSKFVPIYYVFRTANFTNENINELFGDLITGLGFKSLLNVLFVTLTTLFLCLASFNYIKGSQAKVEETKSISENLLTSKHV